MLKFIVISFLIFFIVYKLIGFFFRMLLRSGAQFHQQQYQAREQNAYGRKPSDGNVNIDYIPKPKKAPKEKKTFNGGEYIDYEEVK